MIETCGLFHWIALTGASKLPTDIPKIRTCRHQVLGPLRKDMDFFGCSRYSFFVRISQEYRVEIYLSFETKLASLQRSVKKRDPFSWEH